MKLIIILGSVAAVLGLILLVCYFLFEKSDFLDKDLDNE